MTTVRGVHKLRMEGQNRRDSTILQPGDQPVDIDKIAVDTLQMYHIRLFFFYPIYDPAGRPPAASIWNPCDPCGQAICFAVEIAAYPINVRFLHSWPASVQHN